MKSAVIAGGTGAVFKGFTGQGSFGETSAQAFADPGARFSALGQGLTGEAPLFQSYSPSTATATATPQYEVGSLDAAKNSVSALNPPPPAATTDPSFLDRAKDFIMPENVSTTDALKQMGVNPAEATATQLEIAKEMAAEQSPGFIRRYGPSLALAGIGAGAMGFFDAPEEAEPEFLTGADLLARDRDKYALPDEQIICARLQPVCSARAGVPSCGGRCYRQQARSVKSLIKWLRRKDVGDGSMSGPFPPIADELMVPSITLGNPFATTDLSPLGFPRIDPFVPRASSLYLTAAERRRRSRGVPSPHRRYHAG